MAKIRLLLLFGGSSSEYADSLRSAACVMRTLRREQHDPLYDIIPVGISPKGRWLFFPGDPAQIEDGSWVESSDCSPAVLSPDPAHKGILVLEDTGYTLRRVDVIFSLLRGKYGEDGAVQGLCELSRIPYVGNGILSSAVCRNKAMTHALLETAGIHVPHWYAVGQRSLSYLDRECENIEKKLSYPMFVKPSGSDSGMAASIANDRAELLAAVKRAFTQDTTVLVEELASGQEFRVAVFGYDLPFASFVGRLRGKTDKELIIPPNPNELEGLDDTTVQIIRETALHAYSVLECRALALFDFYITERGEILLGEVNTMPVLAEHDAYPALMANLGMRYSYLLEKFIEQAAEHADR